ncbi:uncharacterized protein LOC114266278 [Camellia sinensis]|uniref:uncharacterized protein LOC114266278 n=1 Tax=Camellia sinensis TaxID=4442 RepID=UPI00103641B1|nr:uncharacterized protein LOC114266278 [Camellia sinensis]
MRGLYTAYEIGMRLCVARRDIEQRDERIQKLEARTEKAECELRKTKYARPQSTSHPNPVVEERVTQRLIGDAIADRNTASMFTIGTARDAAYEKGFHNGQLIGIQKTKEKLTEEVCQSENRGFKHATKGLPQVLLPQQGFEEAIESASSQAQSPLAVLPNVPNRKKIQSPLSVTTPQTAFTSQPDQGSISDPAEQPSTSAPYLIPLSQRRRRRRTVFATKMGRQSKLMIVPTTSTSVLTFGVDLTTALLLSGDLDRNAEMTEYENFALMLQHSAKHAHSFSMQSFEIRKALADKTREVASLQKASKKTEAKMKTLADQAEAAVKAKDVAEEKADVAEAINKALEAQRKEAKEKTVEAQKELQDALATKAVEVKVADEKAYAEGVADVMADYEKQEGEEVPKDATLEKASWDVPLADKSLDQTLQEIDAKLATEKAAEMSSQ